MMNILAKKMVCARIRWSGQSSGAVFSLRGAMFPPTSSMQWRGQERRASHAPGGTYTRIAVYWSIHVSE
jgi:hypothetical protein